MALSPKDFPRLLQENKDLSARIKALEAENESLKKKLDAKPKPQATKA